MIFADMPIGTIFQFKSSTGIVLCKKINNNQYRNSKSLISFDWLVANNEIGTAQPNGSYITWDSLEEFKASAL